MYLFKEKLHDKIVQWDPLDPAVRDNDKSRTETFMPTVCFVFVFYGAMVYSAFTVLVPPHTVLHDIQLKISREVKHIVMP